MADGECSEWNKMDCNLKWKGFVDATLKNECRFVIRLDAVVNWHDNAIDQDLYRYYVHCIKVMPCNVLCASHRSSQQWLQWFALHFLNKILFFMEYLVQWGDVATIAILVIFVFVVPTFDSFGTEESKQTPSTSLKCRANLVFLRWIYRINL